MEFILKHFPDLTEKQITQFKKLKGLYEDWNTKINVISRKDIESFYTHHVLHSLAIAKIADFIPGTKVLDVGTGGGFPGIPLAIFYPEVQFHLVDSIGKKIKVVNAIAESLGLENVKAEQARVEDLKNKYDFIVSRAVTHVDRFLPWVKNKFEKQSRNQISNGYFFLKGGDLAAEFQNQKAWQEFALSEWFENDFFETKRVVYLPA